MSKVRTLAVSAADLAVLVVLRPDTAALRHGLAAPRRWLSADGADAVVARLAGAALWLVAAWVGIGLLAALAAHLPGTAGRAAAAVATVALPAVLRRIVVGSAGLGVLLAPVAAQARGHADVRTPTPAPVSSTSAMPGPSWPGTPLPASAPPSTPSTPLPGPAWPRTTVPAPTPPATPAPSAPSAPQAPTSAPAPAPRTTAPDEPAPSPPRVPAAPAPPSAGTVTVRTGDCLWMLAAHRLGPRASDAELAAYVPQLYAANRSVIGADPDLVTPGQVLDLPAAG